MWDSRRKILSLKDLVRHSEEMQKAGRRLVLTNGCFDVLHAGHVRYLGEARGLGDALVVGVNSDSSARRLKGPGRPINSEADRAEVVSSLAAVDFVVIFPEDTAVRLVEDVRPSVYVKGGDYSSDPDSERFPPEGDAARRCGAEIRVLPYLPDRSSSAIIQAQRNEGDGTHS